MATKPAPISSQLKTPSNKPSSKMTGNVFESLITIYSEGRPLMEWPIYTETMINALITKPRSQLEEQLEDSKVKLDNVMNSLHASGKHELVEHLKGRTESVNFNLIRKELKQILAKEMELRKKVDAMMQTTAKSFMNKHFIEDAEKLKSEIIVLCEKVRVEQNLMIKAICEQITHIHHCIGDVQNKAMHQTKGKKNKKK